jgi:hypothetical protein
VTERAFDAERDCHDSYYAAVAELRRRFLAGEYIPPEWHPETRSATVGEPAWQAPR